MTSAKLNNVDQETSYLVSGYIRAIQKEFNERIIPTEVIDLCIIYYFITEFFSKCGKDMKISADNDSFTTKLEGYSWNTAYGNNIIDMNKTPNLIYEWTIQCTEKYFILGLESTDFKNINTDISDSGRYFYKDTKQKCKYYGWYTASSLHTNNYMNDAIHHKTFNEDWSSDLQDIDREIMMELNCKNKTISYSVNNKNYGIAFKNVEATQQYRLGVSMCTDGTTKLLNFKTTKAL